MQKIKAEWYMFPNSFAPASVVHKLHNAIVYEVSGVLFRMFKPTIKGIAWCMLWLKHFETVKTLQIHWVIRTLAQSVWNDLWFTCPKHKSVYDMISIEYKLQFVAEEIWSEIIWRRHPSAIEHINFVCSLCYITTYVSKKDLHHHNARYYQDITS